MLVAAGMLGDAALRHDGQITALAVAADDSAVLAADGAQPGRATLWDLATGAARVTVFAEVYALTAAAISDDGTRIAISGYDRDAIVFDAATGDRVATFELRERSYVLVFSPDGKWLLAGDARIPRLYPLADGEPRALKGHRSDIKAAAISRDGRFAATAGGDRAIKLHDVAKAKVLATFEGYPSMVAFTPDGAQLVYVGWDGAGVIDVAAKKLARQLPRGQHSGAAALSRDGRRLAITAGGGNQETRVTVYDLATDTPVFERTFEPVRPIALTSTGDRLVVGRSAVLAQGTSLEVWSVPDGERLLPRGGGHLNGVAAVAPLPGAVAMAVSAGTDRALKLWDLDGGVELESIAAAEPLAALAIAPDGRLAVTARESSRATELACWDLRTLSQLGDIATADLGAARAIAISPDGRTVAASFVRRAALYDLATRSCRAVLEKHRAQVDAIAFSHDGRFVITGAADHLVKVWSAGDGALVRELAEHDGFVHALAALPDGTLVSASSDLVRWDLATGERLVSVRYGEVSALAASPDGEWLVSLTPFRSEITLWPLADRDIGDPVHVVTLDAAPACAAFVGPRALLVGLKNGRIARFTVSSALSTPG